MHPFAALVPPVDVLDHVNRVVADVQPVWTPPTESGLPGRHLASSKRFSRRRDQDIAPPPPPRPIGPQLDLVPPFRMHVPVAKFGSLALADTARLADALEAEASGWESPRLHLHGGVALEPEGDVSVWVGLGGDLNELNAVVQGVSRVAHGLHLFVDRRRYRPHVQLGTINDRTTEEYLEQVLAALQDYESPAWWQVTLSLLVPIDLGPAKPPYRLFREVPLGPAVPH